VYHRGRGDVGGADDCIDGASDGHGDVVPDSPRSMGMHGNFLRKHDTTPATV
jgi:hypothetical protein